MKFIAFLVTLCLIEIRKTSTGRENQNEMGGVDPAIDRDPEVKKPPPVSTGNAVSAFHVLP
jgi:hypothetical protein